MSILTNVHGKSQYDSDIDERLQSSACGPVTAFVLLNHLFPDAIPFDVNELYRKLKSTRVGLFKWRFIRNLRKLLPQNWTIAECDWQEMKRQIDEGRPVAAKFDKWFSFQWRGSFAFDYHWVPVIGYELVEDDLILVVHDNGSKNRNSSIRKVSYKQNQSILSFIKIENDKSNSIL
ncbi:C39 family peptidase [Sporosarcina sp. CAU 1771]